MEMKISHQTGLCLFVKNICGLSDNNRVYAHPEPLHFLSLLTQYLKTSYPTFITVKPLFFGFQVDLIKTINI